MSPLIKSMSVVLAVVICNWGAISAVQAAFSITPVALSGTQADGFPPGVVYRNYPAPSYLDSSGRVLFQGYTLGTVNAGAWWVSGPNGAQPVPIEIGQTPAADAPGYFYLPTTIGLIGDGGHVAFLSDLTMPGSSTVEHGVFVGTANDIHLAARSNQPIDELRGGVLDPDLFGTDLISNGTASAFGASARPQSSTTSTPALWTASADGTIRNIATSIGGSDWPFIPRGVDQNGQVGFLANNMSLYIGTPGRTRSAGYNGSTAQATYTAAGAWAFIDYPAMAHVYVLKQDQSLHAVATTGDQAPGMPNGVTFHRFDNIIPSRTADNLLFRSALSGAGVNDANPFSTFVSIGGATRLIARDGMSAPGLDPSIEFLGYGDGAVNDVGQVLLYSYLQGPGVTQANDQAIWYDSGDGEIRLLLREGSALNIDGETKIVNGISARFISSGALGIDSLNDAGQFTCHLSFTDGTGGVFLLQIPEPSAVAIGLTLIGLSVVSVRHVSRRSSQSR